MAMATFKPVLHFDIMNVLKGFDRPRQKALAPFLKQDSIKREFGNRLIDKIKNRTLSGQDKYGDTFAGAKGKAPGRYSDFYKNSLPYKIYRKIDKVNLRLTGQMQASINVVGVTATGVDIGFLSAAQAEKAKRHVTGEGPLPIRDFWGVSKDEQEKILKGVIKDFNANQSAQNLLDALSFVNEVTASALFSSELTLAEIQGGSATLSGDQT